MTMFDEDKYVNDRIKVYDVSTDSILASGLMWWAASGLGSSAIEYAGGKVLERLMVHAGFDPPFSLGDLGDLILEKIEWAVKELKQFIQDSSVADNMQDARDKYSGVIKTLRNYNSIPVTSPPAETETIQRSILLSMMLRDINEVLAAYQSALHQGGHRLFGEQYGCDYACAAGTFLAIIGEHIKHFGASQGAIAVNSINGDMIPYMLEVKRGWKKWSAKQIDRTFVPHPPGGLIGGWHTWTWKERSGIKQRTVHETIYNALVAVDENERIERHVRNYHYTEFIAPIDAIIESWKKQAIRLGRAAGVAGVTKIDKSTIPVVCDILLD